jgi:pilus assembly protein Flp/PilA
MAKTERKMPPSRAITFLRAADGTAALEYGMIAALIAMVVLGAVITIGSDLNAKFSQVATATAGGKSASPGPSTGGSGA